MSVTINNGIPFVPENTIDPAAGLNLAINVMDALLQVGIVALQNDPPVSPVEGDRYIVGTVPTGAWVGYGNKLARYLDGGWSFYSARYAVGLTDGFLYVRNTAGWANLKVALFASPAITTPSLLSIPVYANNAAAIAGGLTAGKVYRTGADPDPLMIVH